MSNCPSFMVSSTSFSRVMTRRQYSHSVTSTKFASSGKTEMMTQNGKALSRDADNVIFCPSFMQSTYFFKEVTTRREFSHPVTSSMEEPTTRSQPRLQQLPSHYTRTHIQTCSLPIDRLPEGLAVATKFASSAKTVKKRKRKR